MSDGQQASEVTPTNPGPLWRDRRFGPYWAAQTVSEFGDRISELALPLIAVILLRADPSQVSALTAAIWLPNMLSLFVGAWVDSRARKRKLLILADLLRAVALLSLPLAYLLHEITLPGLFIVALVVGSGQVLFDMVYPAFFVALVPPTSYLEANSKLSASVSASYVAGPAVGGVLIQVFTAPFAVIFDAASFLFSAAVINRIRVAETPPADAGEPMRKRITIGMRFIATQPILRASLACSAMMNFFMFVAQALIILYANRTLGLSAGTIGLAFGIGAGGGLIIAVFARRIAKAIGVGHSIVVGAVLYPAPMALLSLAHGPHWIEAIFIAGTEMVSSAGVMLFDINHNSLRTAITPDATRSRAAGAYAVVNYGCRPLGALAGGALGTAIGLRPTLLLAAVGGALGALWLLFSPIPGVVSVPAPQQQA